MSFLEKVIKTATSPHCEDPLSSVMLQHALKHKAASNCALPLDFQMGDSNPLGVSSDFCQKRVFMVKVIISGILILKSSLLELFSSPD